LPRSSQMLAALAALATGSLNDRPSLDTVPIA
jgi:hypothetical protein